MTKWKTLSSKFFVRIIFSKLFVAITTQLALICWEILLNLIKIGSDAYCAINFNLSRLSYYYVYWSLTLSNQGHYLIYFYFSDNCNDYWEINKKNSIDSQCIICTCCALVIHKCWSTFIVIQGLIYLSQVAKDKWLIV